MIIYIEGELRLIEYEGGFAPCEISINNTSLDMVIARKTGIVASGDRGFSLIEDTYLGRAKITIELLDRSG